MNKISIVLNVILLLAVGVLFYLYVSLSNKISPSENATGETPVKTTKMVTDPSKLANAKIAYLNLDSLDMNYEYIEDKSNDIGKKRVALESQLNNMIMSYQQNEADLQQSYQSGIKPEAELQKDAMALQQKQIEIAKKEKQLQALGDTVATARYNMFINLTKFIEKYNNGKYDYILAYTNATVGSVLYAKPDLDLTTEIINGLNEEYRQSKTKEAEAAKNKSKKK